LAAGVVVLLFTAFGLWGTGIFEAHSQSVLRGELAKTLPPGTTERAGRIAAHPTHPSSGKGTPGPPTVAPPVPAPAAGQPIGTIQIPNIGLDQVVVEGVGTDQLEMGPGHYPGTPLPGEQGNVAIAGHRTTYAHPFYDLDQVTPGRTIVLTTAQGIFVYIADGQQVVQPTDVAVVGPSPRAELTLTTCNPRYSAATRLVVTATLTSSLLFPTATPKGTSGRTAGGERSASRAPDRATAARPGTGLAVGGGESARRWAAAVGLGVAVVAIAVAVWRLARRVRRRWAVYVPGAAAILVVLFFFFAAITPLLPASL
jgi:sortase A